jgi:hypothetical protein
VRINSALAFILLDQFKFSQLEFSKIKIDLTLQVQYFYFFFHLKGIYLVSNIVLFQAIIEIYCILLASIKFGMMISDVHLYLAIFCVQLIHKISLLD